MYSGLNSQVDTNGPSRASPQSSPPQPPIWQPKSTALGGLTGVVAAGVVTVVTAGFDEAVGVVAGGTTHPSPESMITAPTNA